MANLTTPIRRRGFERRTILRYSASLKGCSADRQQYARPYVRSANKIMSFWNLDRVRVGDIRQDHRRNLMPVGSQGRSGSYPSGATSKAAVWGLVVVGMARKQNASVVLFSGPSVCSLFCHDRFTFCYPDRTCFCFLGSRTDRCNISLGDLLNHTLTEPDSPIP